MAAMRDIASGDIVKVFNERGAVLGRGAYVSRTHHALVPCRMDHGARADFIVPGVL